jgi:integrase
MRKEHQKGKRMEKVKRGRQKTGRLKISISSCEWAGPDFHYLVSFPEQGKRGRKFCATKKEAESFAFKKESEIKRGGTEAISFPTSWRVMAGEAMKQLEPLGKDIRDAAAFYVKHHEATTRSIKFSKLLSELLEKKKKKRKRYLDDLKNRLSKFAETKGEKVVSHFTSNEIQDWLDEVNGSATNKNNFRRVLHVAFNWAVKRGYCESNPVKNTDREDEITAPVEILTVDQLTRLLEKADDKIKPFIAIGAFAGLRRAEIERLTWSMVKTKTIEVPAISAKTASRRPVKIEDNLKAWLSKYKSASNNGNKVIPKNYRKLLEKAYKDARIQWKNNLLRHSFGTYYLQKANNPVLVAIEMGHTTTKVVYKHYKGEFVSDKEAADYFDIRP